MHKWVKKGDSEKTWEKTSVEDGGIWQKGGCYDNEFKNCFKCKAGRQRHGTSQFPGVYQAALAALRDLHDAGIVIDTDFQVCAYERYSDRVPGLQSI